MTPLEEHTATAVVCAKGDPHRAAMEIRFAVRGGPGLRWYELSELHELDRAVRSGRIRHVVLCRCTDLLPAVWDEEIELAQWPPGVTIELLEEPASQELVHLIEQSWQHWRRRHRRRQQVAGLLVSGVVLALSFLLCVVLAR